MPEELEISVKETIQKDLENLKIPKKVFIVPYRNRPQQKFFFEKYMTFLLEDYKKGEYEIYFSHQADTRSFNRGATKNIGFLAIKNKYPNDYQDINFIFNDVDTIPFHKIFDYETTPGTVKHYYGFKYALGGIVVIKGGDFEMINGYPNFWGWGNEDNCLQNRCLKHGIEIDRNIFFPIGSPQILQLFDGISRIISKRDYSKVKADKGFDGLKTIRNLNYNIDKNSVATEDNTFTCNNDSIQIINITYFLTNTPHDNEEYYEYDLREPTKKIVHPDKNRKTNKIYANTDDWKKIPFYPTIEDRKRMANNVSTIHQTRSITPSYLYSQNYAKQNGIKPRATTSIGINLGGIKNHI